MAEDPTEPHWWQTLPAILGGIAAVIGAITTLLGVLGQLPWQHPKQALSITTTSPTTTSPTTTSPEPPRPAGTDAQGFLDSSARCEAGTTAVVMGRTAEQSVLVLCRTGPGAFYYVGVRLNDGKPITLPTVVQEAGGFEVTNLGDGTQYEIQPPPGGLTITMHRQTFREHWDLYWPPS